MRTLVAAPEPEPRPALVWAVTTNAANAITVWPLPFITGPATANPVPMPSGNLTVQPLWVWR